MATKGDALRSDLKEAIKELDVREKKDRPKTLKRGNKSAPKKLDFDSSEKNLRKEFDLRFDNPKFEDKRPKRVPGQQREKIPLRPEGMTSLAKGGRAVYKAGSKGCKLAMKGKGRAYGKNS